MASLSLDQHTSYRDWTSEQVADWIISLDASYEEEYREVLTQALSQHNITGQSIEILDETDFQTFGIINHDHRRKIFAELQKLIANKKRRDSLHLLHPAPIDDDMKELETENAGSLSDDEEEDKLTILTEQQWQQMRSNGYCALDDPLKDEIVVNTVVGWLRRSFPENWKILPLLRMIVNYYHTRYNTDLYVEICCKDTTEQTGKDDDESKADSNEIIEYFLVPKKNLTLSGLLVTSMELKGNRIEIDQKKISTENMHRVLRYLGHHQGVRPEAIAKPIRSTKMERIVTDLWDAEYINALSKKEVFQVILAANYLDCACLLHLGAAKIATLIKGKSPEEIRSILADDNKEESENENKQDGTGDDDNKDENDVATTAQSGSGHVEEQSNEDVKEEDLLPSFVGDVQAERIVCDESQSTVKVQIVMIGNQRETVKVNMSTTVKQLYAHAKEVSGYGEAFKLFAGFPRTALTNPDATVQDADLAGCSIIQQAV
eukprot:CAMPEP_0197027108 /NCGR_PEP_ID=MMETSP1384-20130603/7080_1 /TAXON_ID=29189 /ORGANISM="Ammonia sp." /LENGTH=489 /DNA_ID=CAMNT_0042455905 /DNA_START=36 /DNA_END=1505 /DNA_ORIENTATION=-